jgi:hypothetical protein
MRVQFNSSTRKAKQLRVAAPVLCSFAAFCLVTVAAHLLQHNVFAQDSPLPSTSSGQLGISPEEPVAPPQPIVIRVPAPATAGSQEAAKPAKVEMPAIPDPDPANPVAVQSANLLKLAYTLKSEVDKTTKDTLSVTVVRQAAEIEQMARKMRAK